MMQALLKLREVGHKNRKIELIVFILKKDSINYLFISTFDWSCFKIDLNGRVSNLRTPFKKGTSFERMPVLPKGIR